MATVKPPFQVAQDMCFDTILKLYGQDGVWKKSGGDVTDLVLFNDPTKEKRFNIIAGRGLSHVGYDNADINVPYIEYRKGQFEGLYELVYEQNSNQRFEVDGKLFVTTNITTFFDGDTCRIALQLATNEDLIPE